jgi:hypothetical protein
VPERRTPLWEWILIVASLAIPVTGVVVAATFLRDPQNSPSGIEPAIGAKLRVPSFASEPAHPAAALAS